MKSLIYILAQFTSEALLFEALIICFLFCCYAAFWILKKRRFGLRTTHFPAGPVHVYLNELIGQAEQLRLQLFGLLSQGPVRPEGLDAFTKGLSPSTELSSSSFSAAAGGAGGAELAQKLQAVEAKMAEQAQALQTIREEKANLEKKLSETKSGEGASNTADLQNKLQELEGKLAEYSVIEDDLANLKRLQQENAYLKNALAEKGGLDQSQSLAPAAAAAPVAAPSPTPPSTPAAEAEPFAKLAAQVESSLSAPPEALPPASGATSAATLPPPAPEPVLSTPPATGEKGDADLVAEFEKMLKS